MLYIAYPTLSSLSTPSFKARIAKRLRWLMEIKKLLRDALKFIEKVLHNFERCVIVSLVSEHKGKTKEKQLLTHLSLNTL